MLDDLYDTLEYGEETEADIDARVRAEARHLTASAPSRRQQLSRASRPQDRPPPSGDHS
ncbi:hypothetical protein V2I01_09140 [Micromonospora sp. BRA006-A]|nr:hypothetical protein [Micromonospora sp. BRA006-A]